MRGAGGGRSAGGAGGGDSGAPPPSVVRARLPVSSRTATRKGTGKKEKTEAG